VTTDVSQFEAEAEARIRRLYDYTRDEDYPDVVVLKDLTMRTRDGYTLVADAYVPARDGVAVEGPKFMLITPTIHGPGPARLPWQGEVYMGEQSTVEWNRLRLSFFDQFLKGIDTGCYDGSWAKMFMMGGGDGTAVDVGQEELPLNNYARWSSEPATAGRRVKINHGGRWIQAPRWPVEPVAPTPFYLHASGGLSTVAPADAAATPTSRSS
jgi:predicted acyl esterase